MKNWGSSVMGASKKIVGAVMVSGLLTIAIGTGLVVAPNTVSANAQESLMINADAELEISGAENNVLEAYASTTQNVPTPTLERRSSIVIFTEYEEWGLIIEGLYPMPDGSFTANPIQNIFYQEQLVRGFSDFGHGVDMSISSYEQGEDIWIHVVRDESGNIVEFDIVQK